MYFFELILAVFIAIVNDFIKIILYFFCVNVAYVTLYGYVKLFHLTDYYADLSSYSKSYIQTYKFLTFSALVIYIDYAF